MEAREAEKLLQNFFKRSVQNIGLVMTLIPVADIHSLQYLKPYTSDHSFEKCIKCINSAECFHSTEARVDFRSVALWVAIPQFPQSPLPIGILG
ncbi:hypothetical protein UY3_14226 [Chelonia mydas]|uniref:Uncharacterized protein n=1 Tax=Chelonia mydas TaxID=8469 RepID=M7BKC4_CHEMY|nr:hypothetical protein UY3_14226 [Chelonia mydas]